MTSLARLPSLIIALHRAARLVEVGRLDGRATQAGLAVGDDGRQRLIDFVRDRGGKLAERRHARDMRELRLRLVQRFFGPLGAAVTSVTAPTNRACPYRLFVARATT